MEGCVPLCSAFPPPLFEFRLLPLHCKQYVHHAYLVHHGVCEVLFDLAQYPCALDLMVTGRGLMVQERSRRVVNVADALKVWQRLQDVLSATWRGHHPCWLSLEVSQLKGRPHHSLSNLACYNEMRALEQAFADDDD